MISYPKLSSASRIIWWKSKYILILALISQCAFSCMNSDNTPSQSKQQEPIEQAAETPLQHWQIFSSIAELYVYSLNKWLIDQMNHLDFNKLSDIHQFRRALVEKWYTFLMKRKKSWQVYIEIYQILEKQTYSSVDKNSDVYIIDWDAIDQKSKAFQWWFNTQNQAFIINNSRKTLKDLTGSFSWMSSIEYKTFLVQNEGHWLLLLEVLLSENNNKTIKTTSIHGQYSKQQIREYLSDIACIKSQPKLFSVYLYRTLTARKESTNPQHRYAATHRFIIEKYIKISQPWPIEGLDLRTTKELIESTLLGIQRKYGDHSTQNIGKYILWLVAYVKDTEWNKMLPDLAEEAYKIEQQNLEESYWIKILSVE